MPIHGSGCSDNESTDRLLLIFNTERRALYRVDLALGLSINNPVIVLCLIFRLKKPICFSFLFFFLILNEMASFLKLSLRLYNVLLYYSLILSAINNYE